MRILRIVITSISMYSRLPVPSVFCDEDDMGHIISALPLTGAVIGVLSELLFIILLYFDIPVMGITLLLTLIPLIVTGGFHADGFMDVQDAFNSGQERTRKLEIMKDPHIGAFAVISLAITGITWIAFLYILIFLSLQSKDYSSVYIYFTSFFIVRSFCGLSSLTFKKAKKNGMLNMETGRGGRADIVILSLQAVIGGILTVCLNMYAGLVLILGLLFYTYLYKGKCVREFGGVTGDTAGYYVVTAETLSIMILVIFELVQKMV